MTDTKKALGIGGLILTIAAIWPAVKATEWVWDTFQAAAAETAEEIAEAEVEETVRPLLEQSQQQTDATIEVLRGLSTELNRNRRYDLEDRIAKLKKDRLLIPATDPQQDDITRELARMERELADLK